MRTYHYIAVACCALGSVALGLCFSPLGIYALISSILLGLASLAFSAKQKNKDNFKGVLYAKICAYALLGISLAVFIGGLIYSAV